MSLDALAAHADALLRRESVARRLAFAALADRRADVDRIWAAAWAGLTSAHLWPGAEVQVHRNVLFDWRGDRAAHPVWILLRVKRVTRSGEVHLGGLPVTHRALPLVVFVQHVREGRIREGGAP